MAVEISESVGAGGSNRTADVESIVREASPFVGERDQVEGGHQIRRVGILSNADGSRLDDAAS